MRIGFHPQLMSVLGSAWCMSPDGMSSLLANVALGITQRFEQHVHAAKAETRPKPRAALAPYDESDRWFNPKTDAHVRPSGLGVLPIVGPLVDVGFGCPCGCWGLTGYDEIEASLVEMLGWTSAPVAGEAAFGLKGVVLRLDTPGGMVMGMKRCANAIRTVRDEFKIPVYAVSDRLCCSAGEALAAQASMSIADDEGIRGSLGTVATHVEISRMLAEAGIDIRHFARGRYKVAGNDVDPRSAETIEVMDQMVELAYSTFAELMELGQGMPLEVFKQHDARCYFGGDAAIEAGLADLTMGYDEFIYRLETGDIR